MTNNFLTDRNPVAIAAGVVLALVISVLAILAFNATQTSDQGNTDRAILTVTPTPPLFSPTPDTPPEPISDQIPEFTEETVLTGLTRPWDIIFLSDTGDEFLMTEKRDGFVYSNNGSTQKLPTPDDFYSIGEGGLMGMAIDPEYGQNNYVYVCYNTVVSDVQVVRYHLETNGPELTDPTPIITGIPAHERSRHSGCQLEFGPDGFLWVGTGDAADETTAQDLQSLGGKVLRVDRDGNAAFDNLQGGADLRVYNYGHRNVQGLGFFDPRYQFEAPGISIEHGSDIDDEVNALVQGNFGWDPDPGYDEAGVPMTDLEKFPDAVEAIWSSGDSTIATSGGTIIHGEEWLGWNQAVAVAAQKGSHVMILRLNKDLTVKDTTRILDGTQGRIRTVQQSPDGSLYVLTDNREEPGTDRVLKLTPR